jgi:hypothetical protein
MKINDHCGRNDRDAAPPSGKPDAAAFEVLHHASSRIEAEGASAGEKNGVNPVHQMSGKARGELSGARSRPADVHAAHAAAFAKDHRASGQAPVITRVADADAR